MSRPNLAGRTLVGEVLDALPAGDPRASASRRDLFRINGLMLAGRILAGLVRRHATCPPRRVLEVGCGDGQLTLRVARRLAPAWPGVHLTLLDRQDIVAPSTRSAFEALGWTVERVAADVFEYLASPAPPGRSGHFDAAMANLFLHHFDDDALRGLFARLGARATIFAASEPVRTGLALAASRAVMLIGANGVTRHDAPASVRAGFRGTELSALWQAGAGSRVLEERGIGPFTHVFAAAGAMAAGPSGGAR